MTSVRAVGIDLGAKALHVVVLDATGPELAVVETAVVLAEEEDALRALCAGAVAVAIDAPSDPSTAVHKDDLTLTPKFRPARCGEIALGQAHGSWVPWVTPPSFDDAPAWMQVGFRVWKVARSLGLTPLEVYPSGAFKALAGRQLAKKTSALGARERLGVLGRHLALPSHSEMWSHDGIDATVAALVAAWSATGGPVVPARHDVTGCDGSAIWIPMPA